MLCVIVKELDLSFFFFQAEDGIRYRDVTGVQTCALPIYSDRPPGTRRRDQIHAVRRGYDQVFGGYQSPLEGSANRRVERGDGLGKRGPVAAGEPGKLPDQGEAGLRRGPAPDAQL